MEENFILTSILFWFDVSSVVETRKQVQHVNSLSEEQNDEYFRKVAIVK